MGRASCFGFNQEVGACIERPRTLKDSFKPHGYFTIEVIRKDKTIHRELVPNGVTNEGKDTILDSFFRNQAQPALWYLGLIDNAGTPALAAGDTMSSHAGWTEAVGYAEAVRPTWVTVAAASQSITNSVAATFTSNGSATLYGIFVPSDSAKSGTAGILWATAPFSAPIPIANLDVLKITYTVNAT